MTTIHASCVAIDGRAVLIAGTPGSGKSDLAWRLIDRGARLVSDDYTRLEARDGVLVASAPDTIRDRIEVRGVGIVEAAAVGPTPVALRIEAGTPERMPTPAQWAMDGVVIPLFILSLCEASAPLKVERLLAMQP